MIESGRSPHLMTVRHQNGQYPIILGRGLLDQPFQWPVKGLTDARTCIISDRTVMQLYGSTLEASLSKSGLRSLSAFTFKPGEPAKSFPTAQRLIRHLASCGMSRNDVIIALGGGVTGDLAGFAAAIYMRGIRYVQIPTTLLAQADSSVGGKTAINLPEGKNLAGAFHAPSLVLCDLKTLDTLPQRHIGNGLAEIIKAAVIGDPSLFRFLETHQARIAGSGNRAELEKALLTAIRLKAAIVEKDERETDARMILNLGHTFAHGLETVTGYRVLLHGEAVGLGMLAATRMACRLGICDESVFSRIRSLMLLSGLPVRCPAVDMQSVIDTMFRDKKARSGLLRFVLPVSIGSVVIRETDNTELAAQALSDLIQPGIAR